MNKSINKSAMFSAAHQIARQTLNKYSCYRAAFSAALKAEYASSKEVKVIEIETQGKAIQPATYKQYKYLISFDNVIIDFRSASQFFKYTNSWEASEAIDAAKSGAQVRIF